MGLTSLIQPTGSGDSGAVGEVDSITNSDGTLTISPTTGAAVASLNVGNANVWTALQTFAAGALLGSNDTLAWGDAVGGGTADRIFSRFATGLELDIGAVDDNLFRILGTAGRTLSLRASNGSGVGAISSSTGALVLDASSVVRLIPGLDFNTDNANDIGASVANRPRTVYAATSYFLQGANAQSMALKQLTELTTIAAAATTDTTIQIPANSLVMGVTLRVTTVIPTAATFDIGVAGATTRYGTGISAAANTTNASPGTTNPTIYAAAVSIRITPNLTPADTTGRVRVTIHYLDLTAPTS